MSVRAKNTHTVMSARAKNTHTAMSAHAKNNAGRLVAIALTVAALAGCAQPASTATLPVPSLSPPSPAGMEQLAPGTPEPPDPADWVRQPAGIAHKQVDRDGTQDLIFESHRNPISL